MAGSCFFVKMYVMEKPPKIEEIKEYIKKEKPLGVSGDFEISDIDPKDPSGHWNFLIKHQDKKYVLRIIGNETPVVGDEIEKEYNILKYIEQYDVGPRVYHLDPNGFIEPVLFEEYLEGKLLTDFSENEQKKYFPVVAKLIAEINQISITENVEKYLEDKSSYSQNFKTWRERLDDISKDSRCDERRIEIENILPQAEKILKEKFEPIIKKTSKVFIFESAHVGHCFITPEGPRFINWEQVACGDPSFTLTVFLASIERRSNFGEIKREMIKEYLRVNPISNFEKLIEGRFFERAVSNCIWVLWAYVLRKDGRMPDETTGVEWRLENVKKLCNIYR